MPLASGVRLAGYEVIAPLGAGGMGEVYRARDGALGREVALKVLPSDLALDPRLLSRFEHEARAASALNHPAIVTIHEVGRSETAVFIVMELVEGLTLRQVIAGGGLPIPKLLAVAAQVADGLAKAHEAGIVHRDLKPENIMLTRDGFAKILDFGLAKRTGSGALGEGPTHIVAHATGSGVILGTVGYMAPEQASAQPVDFRADQFAFGAVLYELATGSRAFQRPTAAQTLAAIITDDPEPMARLNPRLPAPLRWLIERCLAKDPADRYASTRDLARDLARLRDGLGELSGLASVAPVPAPASPGRRRVAAWGAGAIAVLAAAGLALWSRGLVPARAAVRFQLAPPAGHSFHFLGPQAGPVSVSPDGRRLAFAATTPTGETRLFVRAMDALQPQPIAGTEGASYPFWSPDSGALGFFAAGRLKVVSLAGGEPRALCPASLGRGGSWSRDDVILFAPDHHSPIHRIAAAGGKATPLTRLDRSRHEVSHRWPWFLPDQRRFLYLARRYLTSGQHGANGIYLASLDEPEGRLLLSANSNAVYAPPGRLLYVRGDRTLIGQPFDATAGRLSGEALPLAELVQYELGSGSGVFSASPGGVLAYQAGPTSALSQLAWLDRSGRELAALGPVGDWGNPRLSRDGRQVAVERTDPQTGTTDIWLLEAGSGRATRATADPNWDSVPVWSPAGDELLYASTRRGPGNLYRRSLGLGRDRELFAADLPCFPEDWSADGRWIVFRRLDARGMFDLWVVPASGPGAPAPLLRSEFGESGAHLSPDGKWLAFASNEAGTQEVYLTAFPSPGRKWRVSAAGGAQPRWRRDGGELFYLGADGQLMAVEVRLGGEPEIGVARPLFFARHRQRGYDVQYYDAAPDGERFLVNRLAGEVMALPLTVVLE